MAEIAFPTRRPRARQLTRIRLADIAPNPAQPRRSFSENAIAELAASIRQYGLLSPLTVRRAGSGYELIAGERRLRALRLLGEIETDALLLPVSEGDSALIALIENIQRENLNFFEEAEACQALIEQHGLTREELCRRLCRSPSAVANRLRLLKLSPAVRAHIAAGEFSERHARALLRLGDEETQLKALARAAREQMNVRQFDALIDKLLSSRQPRTQPVQGLYRDPRLFVNAMLDTVRTLQATGVGVTSKVTRCAEGIEVTVIIPTGDKEGLYPVGD